MHCDCSWNEAFWWTAFGAWVFFVTLGSAIAVIYATDQLITAWRRVRDLRRSRHR